MFVKLLLLFIFLPLLELFIIFRVSQIVSFPVTLIIIIGTGILGSAMARSQGWRIWGRISNSLNRGELPGNDLIEAFLLLIGGVLLITPGLLTDSFGFLLLIPASRRLIRDYIKVRFMESIKNGTSNFHFHPFSSENQERDDDVIDVEWEEENEASFSHRGEE
jgi:UPF0716 protein FxsA